MPPPDGELQDDASGPKGGFDPDRAVRLILWVTLVAIAALLGFAIYATVHLGGPKCFGTSGHCFR